MFKCLNTVVLDLIDNSNSNFTTSCKHSLPSAPKKEVRKE